jgi:hypothetical protein
MMLFGQKSSFAIEAMIEPHLQAPSTAWGRMCIWCDEVSIGNINEEHCDLGPSFESLANLAITIDHLWLDEFNGMTDLELWNFLDGKLYGYHGEIEIEDPRTIEEMHFDALQFGKFGFLTNWGEQFDRGGKSFLFHHPTGRIKILNRHLPPQKGLSLSAPIESFREAIIEANAWYQEQKDSLAGT